MDHKMMDHCGPTTPFISNHPHQHAFLLVGDGAQFGVHMTQYHHEEHKYQLVMKVTLPAPALAKLATARARFPLDSFVLCNDDTDHFMVPELPARRRVTFKGNIFQGLPDLSDVDMEAPHFFPWDKARTIPLVADIEVTVERIVTFRPFAHHMIQPEFATYLLFGEGREAHMTNLQTARLATGPFEAPLFGPDYDNVMSLQQAPDWLDKPLLEAGVVVTVPSLRLNDPATGKHMVPNGVPFENGQKLSVLYRGMGESLPVTVKNTVLAATAVCNSDGLDLSPSSPSLIMSQTPKALMK
ncbi:hypothetical protein LZA78_15760 [Sinirhodobacter sp. WL0062]|uniref:DUF2169 domain-containing protein n=1 Tax=Rhodobacter flavimaris TaxID=2907145 RepID=A0ABS8YYN9_9RHOB|nr:hypothetical protein [Sinirhodobacter sp. WL0062]MCE5974939.1 hypothetical protein [Sinirhodobacter sp. WL0062]